MERERCVHLYAAIFSEKPRERERDMHIYIKQFSVIFKERETYRQGEEETTRERERRGRERYAHLYAIQLNAWNRGDPAS